MMSAAWKHGLAWVALVCHLLATLGFPLPKPLPKSKDDFHPYPCQSRPCGCFSSEQCWKGDCCCFTIEEKLDWAEQNGIEPPEHVRPLVESHKGGPTPRKKKSCCSTTEPTESPVFTVSPGKDGGKANPATFYSSGESCEVGSACADCVASLSMICSQKSAPVEKKTGVYWVAGIFTKKCHGEGPAGLFALAPAIIPDLSPTLLAEPELNWLVTTHSDLANSQPHIPPTPPPRFN